MRVDMINKTPPVGRTFPTTKVLPEHGPEQRPLPLREPVAMRTVAADNAIVPPIDHERVAAVKKAIEQGKYPLVPSKIADAIIAARYILRGAE